MKLSQRFVSYVILAMFTSALMITPITFVQEFWPVTTSFESIFFSSIVLMNCVPSFEDGLNEYSAPIMTTILCIVLTFLCALRIFSKSSAERQF